MAYHRSYGLDTRIQRQFSFYCLWTRTDGVYGRVVQRFIYSAQSHEDITLQGGGMETMAFLYVQDLLQVTWSVIIRDSLYSEIPNAGSLKEVKILKLT
ncbi:hypothetical protein GCM10007108_13440 [Thermogymnomonas acidicola]|uniref:NAD-dependent epimerase/dehydratase domain-containing protein n=1 Tax=Thermogymnomonas acidicola TaxID=399579 RepID=A0AA37BRZ4_9ARCH|nr:NAD-dependent epimerase/dehydratase family protein [Thermogymnomonas acidicola]GGM76681.1 hypothetical protein GCM10007108_13440 [Thermogymnomonas acidicola]